MATAVKAGRGAQVRVRLPSWLAATRQLASMEMEGTLEAVTDKAVLFQGAAVVRESQTCLRCGRCIDNPVSRLAGYGPICSERLGIPRDFSAEDIAGIREAIKRRATVRMWLPRSRVQVDVLEAGAPSQRGGQAESGPDAKVTVDGGNMLVRAHYRHKARCQGVSGGRWDGRRRAWVYPATPAVAAQVQAAFSDLVVEYDSESEALLGVAKAIKRAASKRTASDLPDIPSTKHPAWLHQRQAFWFAKDMPAAMLAMDMGTGKSKVVVDLVINRDHRQVLVLCPLSVVPVWRREFAKHTDQPVEVLALAKGSVAKKMERASDFLSLCKARKQRAVVVINYESAWRTPFAEFAVGAGWDLVVADESHRLKAPGGKASMFVSRLGRAVPYRLALTGTPMPHSPLDVFAQYRFLDPGVFGTSFNRFKRRYAVMGGFNGRDVEGFRMLPTIKGADGHERPNPFYEPAIGAEWDAKLGSIMYTVGAEVLDLPEYHHVERVCELEPSARRLYRSLERDFYAWVEEGGAEVTAINALTKLLRLQQVTSGFVVDDEGEVRDVSRAKADLLGEVLEDLPQREPVVVFCRFQRDLDTVREVAEAQGRRYGELSGRRRDALTDTATMAEGIDVAGVQIQAGGVGIDLTRAAYAVYYSTGFSLGDYEQSVKRVHRPGQGRPVTYIHLVAENTIDEQVALTLANRKSVVDSILASVKGGGN